MRNSHSNPSPPELFAVDVQASGNLFDVFADLSNLIGQSLDSAESGHDFAQLMLDHGQPAEDVIVTGNRLPDLGRDATAEYCLQVVGVPVQGNRERFERSIASPALNG